MVMLVGGDSKNETASIMDFFISLPVLAFLLSSGERPPSLGERGVLSSTSI